MIAYIGGIEPIKFTTKDGKTIEGYHLHMVRRIECGFSNLGKIFVRDVESCNLGDIYECHFDKYRKLKGHKIEADSLPI